MTAKRFYHCTSCGGIFEMLNGSLEHWLSFTHDGITHPTCKCPGPFDERIFVLSSDLEAAEARCKELEEKLEKNEVRFKKVVDENLLHREESANDRAVTAELACERMRTVMKALYTAESDEDTAALAKAEDQIRDILAAPSSEFAKAVRKTLAFYASETNWENDVVDIGVGNQPIPETSEVFNDHGRKADALLLQMGG